MRNKKWWVLQKKYLITIALSFMFLFLSGFLSGLEGSLFQAVQAANNEDATHGKPATASSYILPYSPGRAVDGSLEPISRWVCANMYTVSGQWLQVDLGGYYTCNRWVVENNWWGDNEYYLSGYTLQKSLDSVNWSSADAVTGNNSSFTNRPTNRFTARYVRLYINAGITITNRTAAVNEFHVYGFPTQLPTITRDVPLVFVDETNVSIIANVTDDGGDNVIERGIVYSTSIDPAITDGADIKVTSGTGIGPFTTALTGLNSTTTYYARPFATNVKGTTYGNNISFNISRAVDTAVSSNAATSVYGQPVTLTATVSVPVPTVNVNIPSGTVSFKDGDIVLGTFNLSGSTVTYTTAGLLPGIHNITAVYSGDSKCDSSTSRILSQAVNKDGTATSVASSSNPSVFGQSVTFTTTVSAVAPGSGVPTGTVTFKDGATTLGVGTLSEGKASYTLSMAVGTHHITAVYSGDDNYVNTSAGLTQSVTMSETATSIESSSSPSVFGQQIIYTSSVTAVVPGSGIPTGIVTFKDGTDVLGTTALSGGKATYTMSGAAVGSHSITAEYSGDINFGNSISTDFIQTVNKSGTTTSVGSSSNPSVLGQSVTYTATVSAADPGSGAPTGTVTFKDGATTLGVGTLSGSIATYTTSGMTVGTHSITTEFSGDGNFANSTSTALSQIVNKAVTEISIASSPNPSIYGQPITLTASVSAVTPVSGTPTGTVTFKDGANIIGTSTLVGGIASHIASGTATGIHSITAEYSGDGSFANSVSTALIQTVNRAVTETYIVSSQNPSAFGQLVTYTATVSTITLESGIPSGTVTFKDGASDMGVVTLNGGVATYTTQGLATGGHSITAEYNGDVNFGASTSSVLAQTVTKTQTISQVISSPVVVYGQPITYTATVLAVSPGIGTPTGIVTFKEGTNILGTGTLNGGVASYTASAAIVGTHVISVEYGGDVNFVSSTSTGLSQTVNKSGTGTLIASNVNPSNYGQSVIYTVTVSSAIPGSGTPTGIVTFKDGTVVLGTVPMSGGIATYTTSRAVGTYNITADYSGDDSFESSASTGLTQTVNKVGTEIFLESSLNPSIFEQTITFSVKVKAAALGEEIPVGTVTFIDGATTMGTVSLSGDTAIYTTSVASTGTHSITAIYSGDSNYGSSTSSVLTQTVEKIATVSQIINSVAASVYGQPITYTASVTAGTSAMSTGIVTFKDGTNIIGTSTLVGGIASYTESGTAVGVHSITAEFSGDSNFTNSISIGFIQTVSSAGTEISLASNQNPSAFGQTVTFIATVSSVTPESGTPIGIVTFKDGSNNIGTSTLIGGTASYKASGMAVGIHSITAEYSGDTNFESSISSVLAQTVTKTVTVSEVVSSVVTSVYGQPITYTATVLAVSPGSGTPTGIVTFKEGTNILGTGTLNGGVASYTASAAIVGNHVISVEYGGDVNFVSSTSAGLSQTVNKSGTGTLIASSVNPSNYGQSVTYTVTVSSAIPGSGTPTGTVTFKDGPDIMGTVPISGGIATYTTSRAVGTYNITADYSGDDSFESSTSTGLTQIVNKVGTETLLESNLNPSTFGQTITFTVRVNSTILGSETPTGSVTFKSGSSTMETVTLNGGIATYTTSSVGADAHSFTVEYNGDTNFEKSTSSVLTQTVSKTTTVTQIVNSVAASVYGQTITYTASVSAGISILPTGIVTFKDGSNNIGTSTLIGGIASYTASGMAVGIHSITAEYSGATNFESSISTCFIQTVNKAGTSTSITSAPNPSITGAPVAYTVTVNSAAPGSGNPTGTVTIKAGTTTLGTVTLNGGTGTYTMIALYSGSQGITAEYAGDSNFNSSISSGLVQTIELSDAEKVVADREALIIGYAAGDSANAVTQNLNLTVTGTVYGSTIAWNSSNSAVLSNAGLVARPDFISGDIDITVTASIYMKGIAETKTFQLTVHKLAQTTYTVTFKDWDGNTIKTQIVSQGSSATAPDNPNRAGYIFTGWDNVITNVTANQTVTAQYISLSPTLTDAEVDAATLSIVYAEGDSESAVTRNLGLTVTGAVYGSTITWNSSNAAVISNDGIVIRPTFASGDAIVTVTATVYKKGSTAIKSFQITVLKLATTVSNSYRPITTDSKIVTITVIPAYNDTNNTKITGTTAAEAKTDNKGNASATVTVTQMVDAVNKTIAEAVKQGEENKTGTLAVVEIKIAAPADVKALETNIPKAAVSAVAESMANALTVSSPIAAITFDQKALDTISQEAVDDVKITISKVEKSTLSAQVKQTVGDRPVFNFSVTSGEKSISKFNGSVEVSVPYTPKVNENKDAIVIYYINAEGKAEIVKKCRYDPVTGTITFKTNHFSVYVVGYNKVDFMDVASNAWYSDAVSFVAARGITTGTGEGKYSAEDKLTRGQFIVMTMRAYGIDPDENLKDNFTDAGNTYYTGYLAAAKRLGISEGIGNNLFAPDEEITRQEIFTLMYKVLKSLDELPLGTGGKALTDFGDSNMLAPWAKEAVTLFARTGIIGGSDSGRLSPTDKANRAEMAQILYNIFSK